MWDNATNAQLYTDLRRLPAGPFEGQNVYEMGKGSWPGRRLPRAIRWYPDKLTEGRLVFVPRFNVKDPELAGQFSDMVVLFQYLRYRIGGGTGPELLRDGKLGPNTLEAIRQTVRDQNVSPSVLPAIWPVLQIQQVATLPGVDKISEKTRSAVPNAPKQAKSVAPIVLAAIAAIYLIARK